MASGGVAFHAAMIHSLLQSKWRAAGRHGRSCVIENTVRHRDGRYVRDLLASTIAIPPRIVAEAAARRGVITSDRNATPPNAAISGTDNCTVAARMAVSLLSAAYQMTYPMPDVSAPEAIARATPASFAYALALAMKRTLSKTASGAARAKFPAVAASGSATPRPRNEYTPHATPAIAINAAPTSGGAAIPGDTR